ncbi:MAG: HDOD domain-containing protein [Xanthomonadales bacterium]|nr:HDOD domain-containing protein [Xanthomonadales bacterium]
MNTRPDQFDSARPDRFDSARLVSLPHVLVDLIDACARRDVDSEELFAVVSRDPALVARVFALTANSPGAAGNSLHDRVALLGRDGLRTLAVDAPAADGIGLETLVHQWRSGVRCAVIARRLARHLQYPEPEEAYLGGLLHNLGEMVLWCSQGKVYGDLCATVRDVLQRLIQEQEQYGVSHPDLGADLLEGWGLNPFLADAVRYHHQPEDYLLDAHPLVRIVFVAASLTDGDGTSASAESLLGINDAGVVDLMARAREEIAEVCSRLDLRHATDEPEDSGLLSSVGARSEALASRIRDMALLGGLGAPGRSDASDGLGVLQRNACLMSGARGAMVFRVDPDEQMLRGDSLGDAGSVAKEFQIRISDGRSLVARSLLDACMIHSFDPDSPIVNVVDRQIQRRLESEGLAMLPIRLMERRLGVLVLGIDRSQLARLENRVGLLQELADAAAHSLVETIPESAAEAPAAEETGASPRIRQIVHEVNNPLSIIRNYIQVLNVKLGDGHPAREDLDIIQQELVRATGLIQQLTGDRGEQEGERKPVAMNSLIQDLVRVSEASLLSSGKIEVELELDDSLPPIVSSEGALKQVLINLIRNAVEAMEDGGNLRIRTRDWFNVDGTPYVELEVKDDGPGIPDHIQAKLFQPVVSTKGEEHAGIGLSIVRELVEGLEGSIGFKTGKDIGTTFRVLLPRKTVERRKRKAEKTARQP